MSTELVAASAASVPATGGQPGLPELVERAGGAARFAWEEYFYAEHHNWHTQRAYLRAVKVFLSWAEGQGVELAAITPGRVGGQAESAPGGVTRLLRPAGEPARLPPQPGGIGQGRQGAGGRGQDAG